jgi:outer membrane protein OmpA-like peptidoglycan-associated protein
MAMNSQIKYVSVTLVMAAVMVLIGTFSIGVRAIAGEAATVIVEFITLGTVHFGFDSADFESETRAALDRKVELLTNRPELTIVIKGYADSTGPEEYNRKLSEQRAIAVYEYFRAKGVDLERMETVGYGESEPVADNSTREGRALNRRVEIPLDCNEKVRLTKCILWPEPQGA